MALLNIFQHRVVLKTKRTREKFELSKISFVEHEKKDLSKISFRRCFTINIKFYNHLLHTNFSHNSAGFFVLSTGYILLF